MLGLVRLLGGLNIGSIFNLFTTAWPFISKFVNFKSFLPTKGGKGTKGAKGNKGLGGFNLGQLLGLAK